MQSFFDEMFNHLDPYSRYVPPAEAGEDRERRAGAGRPRPDGARPRGGAIVVRTWLRDGPAAIAGIRPGDRMLAIDGQPTARPGPATDRRPAGRRRGHPTSR